MVVTAGKESSFQCKDDIIRRVKEENIRYFKVGILDEFDPRSFNPDTCSFKEIHQGEERKIFNFENKGTYQLVYASPSELLQGKRWAFNELMLGYGSRITRYANHHLLKK